MADTTTISLTGQDDSPSSTSVSLDGSDRTATSSGASAGDTSEPTVQDLKRELETIKAQNERYLRERNGWQDQSRRNLDELNATKERIARLEGAVSARQSSQTSDAADSQPTRIPKLATALQKWANNDDSEINAVEEALARITTPQSNQPQLSKDELKSLVREELASLGARGQRQVAVGRKHPELGDPEHPLYKAVYDRYDAYASDPDNRLLFPKDEAFEAPMDAPDGSEKRMIDVRLVNQMAADLKAQSADYHTRRQTQREESDTRGAVLSGRESRTASDQSVEAIDLLSDAEISRIADLKSSRAWPKEWPKTDKAAAKFLFDGLTPEEKARRLQEYRRRVRTVA